MEDFGIRVILYTRMYTISSYTGLWMRSGLKVLYVTLAQSEMFILLPNRCLINDLFIQYLLNVAVNK